MARRYHIDTFFEDKLRGYSLSGFGVYMRQISFHLKTERSDTPILGILDILDILDIFPVYPG